ncbi:hypothetical protein [Aestuariivirga sp.]|uniref:hypothetical protein n=1 Tax=Aestuariivirga sp. TaxID=2650926 RepID=UPI003BA9A468
MTGPTRLPDHEDGGYAVGYAVIAAAMALVLLLTIPLAAEPLTRAVGLLVLALTGN